MNVDGVAIVGAGRVGLTLARALSLHHPVTVLSRRGGTGTVGPDAWPAALRDASVLLLCVPDDAIALAASSVAALDAIAERHVVLHCSGLHDRGVLAPLEPTGASLGSFHPLMTFTVADGEPDALPGTPAVLEGDDRARAVARAMATRLGMTPIVELAPGSKARYHAGAVFAANYLVVLAGVAERLARSAGAGDDARALYLPLMQRALANVAGRGASASLTGPVERGDAGTVAAHLQALDATDAALYRLLAREAIDLAGDRLSTEAVGSLRAVLGA